MATGRLDDAAAIDRLLAGMPGAEALRPRLAPGRRDWLEHYDAPSLTARYLVADGVGFTCFVVGGVALADARRIAVQTRGLKDWSARGFHGAVEQALGIPIVSTR